MARSRYSVPRYVALSLCTAAVLAVLGLVINHLVDPLLFAGGNQFSGRNYLFNERISKAAYYNGREREFDCFILGSSRMTFLDQASLTDWNCANFSFSGARTDEIQAYLEYLKSRGADPSLVIVGVDRFVPSDRPVELPEFVRERTAIGHSVSYYFSLDVLRFSFESLLGTTRSPNYYRPDLRKIVGFPLRRPGRTYQDEFYLPAGAAGEQSRWMAEAYARITAVFPDARSIGLVPPISQFARARLQQASMRELYVERLLAVADSFDLLVDFSWLPDECLDFSASYDGVHYSAEVWDGYARRLREVARADLVRDRETRVSATELDERYRSRVAALGGEPECAAAAVALRPALPSAPGG